MSEIRPWTVVSNRSAIHSDCPMSRPTRREFLKSGVVLAGGLALPTFVPASALGRAHRPPASERITLGFIGTGNMGMNHVMSFLQQDCVQIVAVCDVNRGSGGYWNGGLGGREPAQTLVNFHYGKEIASGRFSSCDAYEDFREVLERDDIDAVVIATPDHWHAIPVIRAAEAGKDIYCEKPLSLTVRQGRAMSDAVSRTGVVFQTGSQQRSDWRFRRACELVLNGVIGELQTVRCGMPGGNIDFGRTGHRKDPEPVPDGFNYDMWLGPAPEAPYAPARCHVNYRWIFDYSGGQMTDWGGHHPDIAQWGMGTARTGPIGIRNARGVFPEGDLWNTATEYYFEARYANGVTLIVSSEERMGVRFEGTDGWIWVTRGDHETSDPALWTADIPDDGIRLPRSDNHHANFIDCILSRAEPVAPVEEAHRSITIAHLGNIAMRLGRDLDWDPDTETIVGDEEANAMLDRPMREPWTI